MPRPAAPAGSRRPARAPFPDRQPVSRRGRGERPRRRSRADAPGVRPLPVLPDCARGASGMSFEAQDCFSKALDDLPAEPGRCARTDRDAAEYNLSRALAYAQALGHGLQPFIDALDFCQVGIAVRRRRLSSPPGSRRTSTPRRAGCSTTRRTAASPGAPPRVRSTRTGSIPHPRLPARTRFAPPSSTNPARSAAASVVVASTSAHTPGRTRLRGPVRPHAAAGDVDCSRRTAPGGSPSTSPSTATRLTRRSAGTRATTARSSLEPDRARPTAARASPSGSPVRSRRQSPARA